MADVVAAKCDGELLQEHPILDDDKIAHHHHQVPMEQLLDVKKKRLLEELESALVVPKDGGSSSSSPPNSNNPNPFRPSLGFGIEVIDETALLETMIPKTLKNGKQTRRRAAKKTHKKTTTFTVTLTDTDTSSNKYSRKEMESLRFFNVSQQRKFWKAIYATLETTVANEYDTLIAAPNNRHPLPFLPNKKPILTGVGAANGRCRYMNVFVH